MCGAGEVSVEDGVFGGVVEMSRKRGEIRWTTEEGVPIAWALAELIVDLNRFEVWCLKQVGKPLRILCERERVY